MEDSKKRDEDLFTKFFDFVSVSDKRNADLTLKKLMEGYGKILKDIKDCERDQNVLQHINCGFSVDKTFKHIEMLKTKDIYNICISKKFKDSTTKDFLSGNLM